MNKGDNQQIEGSSSRRPLIVDSVLVAAFVFIAMALAITFDLHELVTSLTHPLELYEVDELLVFLPFILALGLLWYSVRRTLDARRAHRAIRLHAAALQTANEKLQASEEELRAANEELQASEEELRASNEELRVANEELQAANEELRETQEQLIRSEKLAAIGQLAGGVGHELRNPLGAIKNAVYYVKGKVSKSELAQQEPRVMEFLDIVDNEINSSNKIINDLLGLSRVGKPSVSPTQIKKVIEDALSRIAIPENIRVTGKLDTDLPEVEIDTDQIQQVFVNMIINAVDAMPEGGKLTIGARKKEQFLEVEITDSGGGIPQDTVDKIFDPLFTTKAKGIGLGLAVCKAIIERHRGDIKVKSEVGKGSTFNLRLPLKAK